jgi:hypothetical protein
MIADGKAGDDYVPLAASDETVLLAAREAGHSEIGRPLRA